MNDMPELSRRDFIKASALAGMAAAFGDFALAADSTNPAVAAALQLPDWCDRPMRWAQLTLVEDDPGKFDLPFWLDYFKRTHSDAACLSAGGCVAYYPTKVPLHYRSQFLGDRDPFGDLVAGCRKLGMNVIARTDPHAAHDDVFKAHPDWIAVDARGRKRRHWASPDLWVTCALGPYNFEFMTEVTKEIVTLYKVDGIFINRWDGSGMCYCEHCQANFKAATGLDLPASASPRTPAGKQYALWRQQRLFELWRLWDKEVRRINPNACVIPNTGGGATSSLDMDVIGREAPILFADRQARSGNTPLWVNGKTAKEYRAVMGRKPIGGIFSVGVEEQYRWKDSVQSPAEIRMWALDGIANGYRPWFTKFAGVIRDPRWLKVVEDVYTWHYKSEKYLRNEKPLARVGLVYSQHSAWYYGADRVEDPIMGFYEALIEARAPFEMVHDLRLDAEHLAPYKLLILPNVATLSKAQCQQLREFVGRGGSLIATSETSLYDEAGTQRPDFGLADLFGVTFKGKTEGPMHNSYLRLERGLGGKAHPLLAGLEDAPRIINGVTRLEVEATRPFPNPPLTLIPSYPDLPMEEVFPRVPQTNIPEVFLSQQGPGRVVYFPWDIDRTFHEVMCADHGTLLRNAVAWAMDGGQPVTVEGPGVLDVTLWQQKESVTVHLVNLSNPMLMRGPVREFLPLPEQKVSLRLPEGKKATRVQFLVAGTEPQFEVTAGVLTLRVPTILDHEVVAVDLA